MSDMLTDEELIDELRRRLLRKAHDWHEVRWADGHYTYCCEKCGASIGGIGRMIDINKDLPIGPCRPELEDRHAHAGLGFERCDRWLCGCPISPLGHLRSCAEGVRGRDERAA
jgi:hypothetical protein